MAGLQRTLVEPIVVGAVLLRMVRRRYSGHCQSSKSKSLIQCLQGVPTLVAIDTVEVEERLDLFKYLSWCHDVLPLP